MIFPAKIFKKQGPRTGLDYNCFAVVFFVIVYVGGCIGVAGVGSRNVVING